MFQSGTIMLPNAQHMTMFSFFALNGAVDLALWRRRKRKRLAKRQDSFWENGFCWQQPLLDGFFFS